MAEKLGEKHGAGPTAVAMGEQRCDARTSNSLWRMQHLFNAQSGVGSGDDEITWLKRVGARQKLATAREGAERELRASYRGAVVEVYGGRA